MFFFFSSSSFFLSEKNAMATLHTYHDLRDARHVESHTLLGLDVLAARQQRHDVE